MKYSTVKDVLASFPHPILQTVEGQPDYQTIHATRKFLQANSRAINTHTWASSFQMLPTPTLLLKQPGNKHFGKHQTPPGRAPATTDGTAAERSAARHIWEEDVQTYRTCTSVQQALKKKIISVFEPMYLEILTTWWDMPTSQQETCWTTSLKPTATSYQSTWRSTSSTCTEPGIPSSQWRPSSSKFKTALTIRRQEASPSVPRSRSTLGMQKYLQQGTS
jgi:hypothetical protein